MFIISLTQKLNVGMQIKIKIFWIFNKNIIFNRNSIDNTLKPN